MANKAKLLTKEQIIDAAYEQIDETGYRNCSMRSLAKTLGVSAMTLYSYVDSKEDIFACVFERFIAKVDVSAVPGERWDDTVRRVMGSWYGLIQQHNYISSLDRWEPSFNSIKGLAAAFINLCLEQGMPQGVASKLWRMCSALTVGAGLRIRGESIAYGQLLEELDKVASTLAERVYVDSYREDAFALDIEAVIGHVRWEAGEAADMWRTPTA